MSSAGGTFLPGAHGDDRALAATALGRERSRGRRLLIVRWRRGNWDVVERIILRTTGLRLAGTLDAELLHLVHQLGRELVVALETEEFILVVGLVEEDDVERHRIDLIDSPDFTDDPRQVVALVLEDKF